MGVQVPSDSNLLQPLNKQNQSGDLQKALSQLSDQGQEQDGQEDSNQFDLIKLILGENLANFWRSTPLGERTELIRNGMNALSRGESVDDVIRGHSAQQNQSQDQSQDQNSISGILRLLNNQQGSDQENGQGNDQNLDITQLLTLLTSQGQQRN